MKINPKSERIISKKRGNNYLSYIGINNNKTIISKSAKRLYKDYEIRQKKMNKLKKELTPTFRPNINKDSPVYYYKTRNKNDRRNISLKIEEIKNNDYIDNFHRLKYQCFNKMSYRNNTPILIKQQKSRNYRGTSNNQIFLRFFNKKESNFKSTDIDSKNTKSGQKTHSNINKTKLGRINENNKSKLEYLNSINLLSDKNKINESKVNTTLRDLNNTSKNNQKNENKNNQDKRSINNSKNSKSSHKKSRSKSNIADNSNNEGENKESNNNDYNHSKANRSNKTYSSFISESKNTIEEQLSKKNKIIQNNINNQEKDSFNLVIQIIISEKIKIVI